MFGLISLSSVSGHADRLASQTSNNLHQLPLAVRPVFVTMATWSHITIHDLSRPKPCSVIGRSRCDLLGLSAGPVIVTEAVSCQLGTIPVATPEQTIAAGPVKRSHIFVMIE